MSRALPAPVTSLLDGANRAHHQRLWIGPPGEALIDLTDYLLPGTVHEEGINEPIDALTLVLDRSLGASSLSPYMSESPPVDNSYNVVWEVAVTSQTAAPTSGDWIELFRGTVWDIDATHNAMVVTCQGLAGKLQERLTLAGQTIAAGTELPAAIQAVIDGPTPAIGVDLYTPVDPDASLNADLAVTHQPVLRAALDLAGSIGWTARYWWNEDDEEFQFTLLEPPRDKTTPDWTTSASRYIEVSEFRKSKADVRNSVTVFYGPPDADGNQAFVTASDTGSIAAHGLLEAFLREGSDSPIQNEAQAQALADAFISDMAWPDVTHTIVDFDLPQIRLWDLIELAPNDVHYNTTQQYAVQTIRREFPTLGAARITLGLRGKPSAGVGTWRRRQTSGSPRLSHVVQFAADTSGTGASLVYDPEVHTHTRYSYDGGATWSEWVPIVGSTILDVHRIGTIGDQIYHRVTFIDGVTAQVYWALFDDVLPDDWMVEVLQPANLREVITESGSEFAAPWPFPDQYLRGIVIPYSGDRVAGDGWEFKANGSEPFIGVDQPMFLESTDGTQTEFRVGIADPRGVVSGVYVYLSLQGVQTGPFPAEYVGGRWSYTFPLHQHHAIIVRAKVARNDGGDPIWLGPYTADTNKTPGIPVTRESRDGALVTIRVDSHDTDTVTQWRREVVGGVAGAEVQIPAVGSDPRFGSFTVTAATGAERVFRVYGKNSSGVAGAYAEVRIGKHNPIDVELSEVEIALDQLTDQVGQFIADGSVDQSEAIAIARSRDVFQTQFEEFIEEYNHLYGNPLLDGTPKSNLNSAWETWFAAYNSLIVAINVIGTAGTVTTVTLGAYESALATYKSTLRTFQQRVKEADNAIRVAGVSTSVDEVYGALGDLNTTINTTFRNGVISAAEAADIRQMIRGLDNEKADLESRHAALYANAYLTGTPKSDLASALEAYQEAHADLVDYILAAIVDQKVSPSEDEHVDELLDAYREALGDYRTAEVAAHAAIAAATATAAGDEAKSYADGLLSPLGAIIRSPTAPTKRPDGSDLQDGDMWINTDGETSEPWTWDAENGWTLLNINAQNIYGTMNVGVLFVGEVQGIFGSFSDLEIDEYGSLRSNNYDPGVAGLHIGGDGHAEFNSVTIRDQVNKTMRIPGIGFSPGSHDAEWLISNSGIGPAGSGTVTFHAPVILPVGAVVTGMRAHMYGNSQEDIGVITLRVVYDLDGTGEALASVTINDLDADFGTEFDAVDNFVMDGLTFLHLTATLSNAGGGANLMWAEVEYTVDNYRQTL